jgi:voltage-gated potassium channel
MSLHRRSRTQTGGSQLDADPPTLGYQIFILALSIAALALAAALALVDARSAVGELLEYADLAVCVVFLIDFAVTLAYAPNKVAYLATWGWLDALSAIPAIDVARWGRAARIFRILRVLRAFRATRVVAALAIQYRARNAVLAAALLLLLTVFTCSVGVLHFEGDASGNIRTAPDALWWAIATVTTVGYGDFYPVTWEGRLIAALLMITGVGVFSALAGAMSSLFLAPAVSQENQELKRFADELADLRQLLEERRAETSRSEPQTQAQPGNRPLGSTTT